VVKTTGDGVHAVFATAHDALAHANSFVTSFPMTKSMRCLLRSGDDLRRDR